MSTAETGWRYHNPVLVHYGRGARARLTEVVLGERVLVVTTTRGRCQFEQDPLLGQLCASMECVWIDEVETNPGLTELQRTIDRLRDEPFDAVVAFGGGSAVDSAKVLAVALSPELAGTPLRALLADPALHREARPKQLYALPTTSGTGSEVTPYATVWDREERKKYSLAGPAAFPYMAIVDPDLTDGLPEAVTLSTGLDAINQAAEAVWSHNMTPLSEAYSLRALRLGFHALPRLLADPDDRAARADQAECSLLAGLAISQTKTGLCHSMSYPITAHFGVPHGLACAFTMPAVLRHNLHADEGRFNRMATAVVGEGATLVDLVDCFDALHADLQVGAQVRETIGGFEALLSLAGAMFTPGRADNNLADVDGPTIEALLRRAWDERYEP